jgi:hypothetical protein
MAHGFSQHQELRGRMLKAGTPFMGDVEIEEMKEIKTYIADKFEISFISSIAVDPLSHHPL